MTEIVFDKYQKKGAYHWTECFGPVHRRNAYTMGRYDAVLKALTAAGVGEGDKVLDVGCGDAALSGMVVMQLKTGLLGVDTESLSIELARKEFAKRSLSGEFAIIDGYRYPADDASVQAVICSDVIEHVQQPEEMLREMWRTLAPGGVLVITTPVRYTEQPLDKMHVQEWFPSQFKALCAEALGVPVELELSHPVALAEAYASSRPLFGRLSRLTLNVLATLGWNAFGETKGFRAFSTQTVIARKPR